MKLKNEVEKAPWNIKLIIARMLLNLTQKEAADKIWYGYGNLEK
jgi:hypothetical protein